MYYYHNNPHVHYGKNVEQKFILNSVLFPRSPNHTLLYHICSEVIEIHPYTHRKMSPKKKGITEIILQANLQGRT